MKELKEPIQNSWNDFAQTLPWIAGVVAFLNAIFAVRVSLVILLTLALVVDALMKVLVKKVLLILGTTLAVQALIAGILNQSMRFGDQIVVAPWGPSLCWSSVGLLQLTGVGNWPIIKHISGGLFQAITYYAGVEPVLDSPLAATTVLMILAWLIQASFKETGHQNWAEFFILLPLYYGLVYGVSVTDSLSLFFVFAVVSKALKKDRSTMGAHMSGIWALLLSLVLVMGSLSLQVVVPFEGVEAKVQKLLPDLLKNRDNHSVQMQVRTFDWALTPYYPLKSRLGGPIERLGNKVVFKVKAAEAPLYLRGSVRTVYDGKNWSAVPMQVKPDSAYGLNGDLIQGVLSKDVVERLDLEEIDLHQDILFSPLGFWKSDTPLAVESLGEGVHSQRGSSLQTVNTKYSIYYSGVDKSLENRNRYLDLPELPALKALVESLTDGATSDEEKLNRLQVYLKDTCKYELKVPIPPVEQDFVSYFLFESKKGYCTYFASAMTLMAREAGIPARYVEGYLLSPLKYEKGYYYVTEDLAHAWAEVYLEGMGWVTAESTPAYDFNRIQEERSLPVVPATDSIPVKEPLKVTQNIQKKATTKTVVWSLLTVGLLSCIVWLHIGATWGISRWFYKDQTRRGYLRRLYYYEFVLEKTFEGDWQCFGVPYKMSHYFLIETEASLLVFDDIIKTAECVLYNNIMPSDSELCRLNEFIQQFERHYLGKMTRIYAMLNFLKGWTNVGADGKGTTS